MIYDLFKYLQIMIPHWDIFVEFRFYNMWFNRGTLLKGEFGPSGRPCPFFDVLFFFFTHANRITAHPFLCSNKRGGGSYIPKQRAPVPP